MSEITFLHDMVDPEDPDGRTYREVNLEKIPGIPVGTLVEVKRSGVRLFVVAHRRDCDGTPLYCLGPDRENTRQLLPGMANPGWSCGYAEDSLTVLPNPVSIVRDWLRSDPVLPKEVHAAIWSLLG